MGLRIGGLALGGGCRLMGVLNVTPDSFSDGGRYASVDAAIARGVEMARHGAEIIDIGGESTRPDAAPVELAEELRRVIPVVEGLRAALTGEEGKRDGDEEEREEVALSIDTRKPEVARAAVTAGAVLVNDVGGLRDPAMVAAVAELGVPVVAMHMRETPVTMQAEPVYDDVMAEVHAWLDQRLAAAEAAGVERSRVIVDPGIGFGKLLAHNLALLAHLDAFRNLGGGVMVGASRKSFIGDLTGCAVDERLGGSVAAAAMGALQGVDIVRAHDIRITRQALDVVNAVAGYRMSDRINQTDRERASAVE